MSVHLQKRRRKLQVALILSMVCALRCGAEIPTSIAVHPGPSFELVGSGRLAKFTVYAPRTGRRIAFASSEVSVVIWQVVSAKGYFAGGPVEGMRVVYGIVPQSYVQTIPEASEKVKAPPLEVVSTFFAETTDAPGIGGAFFMGPMGPIPVDIRDHCLRLIDGREVEVNCQTDAPYQEPSDMQRFVREHRIGK
jgi:hypothetical protein